MTGLELIRQIRDDSDIPIIFLSDDDNIQALVMVFDMGVNDFIVVPINRAIFIARLKALIRRSIWDIVLKNSGLWNSYIRNMV
jgi:two-component system response regulator ChvI